MVGSCRAAPHGGRFTDQPLRQLGNIQPPDLGRIKAALTLEHTERGLRLRLELGGHSLKRGALTTGMDHGAHPTKLKRLGRHKSYELLGEYLEFGDLFEGHPLGGVL